MFEDSTFESTGRIHTRSHSWMLATFVLNGSILLALILIPLIYPEALPRQWMSILIEAPRLPAAQPEKPKPVTERNTTDRSELQDGHVIVPTLIPPQIRILKEPEAPREVGGTTVFDLAQDRQGVNPSIFQQRNQPSVAPRTSGTVRVPSTIAEGLLLEKRMPVYPVIAKATHTEGTVVLQATISKSGTIENLRVLSGHPMLQMAALDAVSRWRYRPYLLNGQPVEVETTINVIFKLSQ